MLRKAVTKNYPSITWLQEKMLKHQDEKGVKTIRIGNLNFHYKYPFEILHTYRELYEQEIYRFESSNHKPLIIDCGANIGLSVLYFKSLYPNATVIAYEPDADNVALLKRNIDTNGLSDVIIKQEAVWVKEEKLYFRSNGSQGSQIATTSNEAEKTVEVNAIRLATVLEKNIVDFLKIDIEGAEIEVMKDCASSLGNVRHIFVEYHGKVNETAKLIELLSILEKNEFKVYIKMAADALIHPFVKRQSGSSFDVQLNIFGYR